MIGVRLSAFDHPPFKPDPTRSGAGKLGPGIPEEFEHLLPYVYGFGCNPNNPLEMDLPSRSSSSRCSRAMGVRLINVSCCSPYYNPHYPAAGDVPAERRLSAAGRSAGRRGAADRRDAAD